MCALQNGDHIKLNAALGKRLKTAVSDFGHLAGLPFLLILIRPIWLKLWKARDFATCSY